MNNQILNLTLSRYPSLQQSKNVYPLFEFHILSSVRIKYDVSDSLFTTSGNAIFPNYNAVRILAQKMNSQRDLKNHPEKTVRAGELNAMGLIDEIYHYILRLYEETKNPKVFGRALKSVEDNFGNKKSTRIIEQFSELFPPTEVYRGQTNISNFLNKVSAGKSNKEITLEEIILLYFSNFNPAFGKFKELFDDKDLSERTIYSAAIESLDKFFQTEKRFGPENLFIFDLLRAPILASPNSLAGQLEYMKRQWGLLLGEKFINRILGSGDLLKEDDKIIFHGAVPQSEVPVYKKEDFNGVDLLNLERFSKDLDWMPNVVLLAKNVHVWLDQLSKKYNRAIKYLNEIPDEELDQLASWNITALWLIGIWERSPASQKIKQWMGNPEAAASAYSLYDYVIAHDLGGEGAFQNLKSRAWQRGIRMSGDMVPNHMGIFSKWIIEHPEYFIQSEYPPFPNYNFSGGNLSDNPDIEIRIEDGYWRRNDAAVVFQRIDRRNQTVRYIYHGNDGTHMPWNDTAQLNFMKAEVREAVIQTIFHVARKFPIIRFDAAMILAKQHFQRLWFPPPGKGGDIPSRADHSMSSEEFNRMFPQEFWREVVDRINAELPNTLLLAEAFWLLEGYFVRTLGMHRVYNSAFMNMLKMEENSKYRELIRNTMHYNPEILKRYVNFMSNPDEQTAIAQFGKEDKYFGTMAMMVTLPGLPMIGHGQIEGLTEKYGMEYRKAYYDEEPNVELIKRHEREVFPLLAKRYLFSQVSDFELYDFTDTHGKVNNDLIAYTNKSGNERAIFCFHNKYAETAGRIRMSVGRNTGTTDNPFITYRTIGDALACRNDANVFYIFQDQSTNHKFLRSGKDLHEKGLYVELKAFGYHVFIDFEEIYDDSGIYERLASHLHGSGVLNMEAEVEKVRLFPVLIKLYNLFENNIFNKFSRYLNEEEESVTDPILVSLEKRIVSLAEQISSIIHESFQKEKFLDEYKKNIQAARQFCLKLNQSGNALSLSSTDKRFLLILHAWIIAESIHKIGGSEITGKLYLQRSFAEIFTGHDFNQDQTDDMARIVLQMGRRKNRTWSEYFKRPEIEMIIGTNMFDNVKYFNKEKFEELLKLSIISEAIISLRSSTDAKIELDSIENTDHTLTDISSKSKYHFYNFISMLKLNEETGNLK
ncbi:MAG: alpha-amylase [Ignavibacteriales bacterium]|nr:alpha-amylase [Ignavibacteriales bacterium]